MFHFKRWTNSCLVVNFVYKIFNAEGMSPFLLPSVVQVCNTTKTGKIPPLACFFDTVDITGYNMPVMIVSFEASANVDTTLFGYFAMKYDPELFQDIKENLTEIKKTDLLSFPCDLDEIKLIYGEFHSVRRTLKVADVEANKFTTVFNGNFDHILIKRFESVKLNIDRDYFYFTGLYIAKGRKLIEFQSLNFDTRFIDSLQKAYNKQECMVV